MKMSATTSTSACAPRSHLAETPVRLALVSMGAGVLVGGVIPLTRWEREVLAGLRASLLQATWRGVDAMLANVRAALADEEAGESGADLQEQPMPPFADLPREFAYEEPVSMLRRISMTERILEEEESTPDLREDVVGDEHPF